jgi:hypothetical protein
MGSGPLLALCGRSGRAKAWVFIPFHSQRTDECAYCWKIRASACPKPRSGRSWRHWRHSLHIQVQAVMQLRSRRREQNAEKERPLIPHFIVSVGRGTDVRKVRFLTELWVCGSKWRRTTLQKDLCNANAVNTSSTRSVTAAMHPGAWSVEMLTRQGLVSPQSYNLNVVAAEETTLQTTVVAVSGKRRRQLLQCERYRHAVEGMVFPRACLRLSLLHLNQLLNRRHLALAGTTSSEGAAHSKLTLPPIQCPQIAALALSPNTRPPTRAVNSLLLVLRRRQRNPTYHAPTIQTWQFLRVSHLYRGDSWPPR